MLVSTAASGFTEISKTYQHRCVGKVYEIKAAGLLPLRLTPEHPVLVVSGRHMITRINHRMLRRLRLGAPYWKDACKLEPKTTNKSGDYILVPRLPGTESRRKITLEEFSSRRGLFVARAKRLPTSFWLCRDTAWLLGMYVAEGYTTSTGISFCLGKHESELIAELFEKISALGYRPCARKTRTAIEVSIRSRILSRAFSAWCGKGARFKRIPSFVISHVYDSIVKGFLDGYMQGDGYESRDHRSKTLTRGASTTSLRLALELQLLLVRLGVAATVCRVERPRVGRIENRTVNLHDYYQVAWCVKPKKKHAAVLEDYVAYPVRSIKGTEYNGLIYNLRTAMEPFLPKTRCPQRSNQLARHESLGC